MVGKRIAVIGAVQERLAAAMLLARRGFQIQVFEKAPVIGGRNAEVVLGDTGLTWRRWRNCDVCIAVSRGTEAL